MATTQARGQGRAAITAAAREVFAERGYEGASVREIAGRAGLSISALYHWHAGKADLLAEVLLESHRGYLDAGRAALARVAPDDAAGQLAALVRHTVDYRVQRRVESRISAREWRNLSPAHVQALGALRADAARLWSDVVELGVRQGRFACEAPDDARRAIEAACNAIVDWYDPAGPVGPDELAERYVAIALRVVDLRP